MNNLKMDQQTINNSEQGSSSRFRDIARIKNGYAFKRTDYQKEGVPLIRQGNLEGDHVNLQRCVYLPKDFLEKYRNFILKKGDVLLGMSGSLGKLCTYDLDFPALQNQRTGKVEITCPEKVDKKYFWYFLNTIESRLISVSRGTGINNISASDIENLDLYLPDKDEQEQIVAKLDQFIPMVNNSNNRIALAKLLIQKFRQAILSAAVTGRLTEKWREENLDRKTAQGIIEAIYKRRLKEAKTAITKKRLENIYSFQEENDSENLPEGWKYFALDKVCESFDYGTSVKSQLKGKVPVLRMGNLQNGEIDWSDLVFTSDKEEIEKYKLKPNTVLFNRTNSPELVGKTSIYRGEQPAIFAGYLIRVNNYPELNPEYLNYCLNSEYAKAFCRQVKSDGVSQSNINAQKLGKFEVSFCSIEEQQEIVKQVRELLAIADKVENKVNKAAYKVEKLTQSILAKAFRGELIT